MNHFLSLVRPLFVAAVLSSASALVAAGSDPMKEALAFREAQAAAVVQGKETTTEAIAQIKAHPNASGLGINPDADFAYAAIDIGQRLVVASKLVDAEKLFRAGEQSLDKLVQQTPDAKPAEKAQYLCKLCLIRSTYLNEVPQAKLDIDRALALQPDDVDVRQSEVTFATSNGQFVKRGPTEVTP